MKQVYGAMEAHYDEWFVLVHGHHHHPYGAFPDVQGEI